MNKITFLSKTYPVLGVTAIDASNTAAILNYVLNNNMEFNENQKKAENITSDNYILNSDLANVLLKTLRGDFYTFLIEKNNITKATYLNR